MLRRIAIALAALALIAPAGIIEWEAAPARASVPDWDLKQSGVPTPPRGSATDRLLIAPKKILKNSPPRTGTVTTFAGTPYFYAGGSQSGVDTFSPAVQSIQANFSLFNTSAGNTGYLDTAHDSHTLIEMALRKTANVNNGLIEVIVTKDPSVCGDSQPRLAVFAWDKNGAGVGYNTSFTLYGSRPISPCDLVTGTLSAVGWIYDTPTQRWWLAANGGWIGYYDNSVFGGSFTFDRPAQVQLFGEVAQLPGGTRTFSCSDMGNGATPSATAGATQMSSLSYNSAATNVNLTKLPSSTGYDAYMISARSLRVGLGGTNSTGGLPGNVGSC